MTPFEEAGYTKDSKFKTLVDYCDLPKGTIAPLYVDDGSSCPYFKAFGDQQEYTYHLYEVELIVEDKPKSNYPNPPHKHAEIIKQWADGAEIEYYSPYGKVWCRVSRPSWEDDIEFRVKPQKSEKDIQIEKLEVELEEAKERMLAFSNGCRLELSKVGELYGKLRELKSNV